MTREFAQQPVWLSCLHLWAIFTLAVTHPLYAVLGRTDHQPFFLAHQSDNVDVLLLVVAWSLIFPMLLFTALGLVRLFSVRLAVAAYCLAFALLAGAALLPALQGAMPAHPVFQLTVAITAGVLATGIYLRAELARVFTGILSLAILAAPILFLTTESMQSLMNRPDAQASPPARAEGRPDVVMIILDELPLISLLDEHLEIDPVRFPNFHRLAATGTWYRNTAAVHYSTQYAVTGLLVGGDYHRYLERVHGGGVSKSGPVDRDRVPHNLFSLVEDHYSVYATELVSHLAPPPPEGRAYIPPLASRLEQLLVDSGVLYAHLLTPSAFRKRLPQIEGQWAGFTAMGNVGEHSPDWPFADSFNRVAAFRSFTGSLQKRNAPSFYFLHSLLPHYPFVYNESGQLHPNAMPFLTMHFREADGSNHWPAREAARLAQQAHLLQLVFTDRLLGRVLDRLQSLDMLDDALVIVTSDHGSSYFWGPDDMPPPDLAAAQASGTAFVPLFIKAPGQREGRVVDLPLTTLDILPTLADMLGLEPGWALEGQSALDGISQDRERVAHLPNPVPVNDPLREDDPALQSQLRRFGSGSLRRLYGTGPHVDLLGRGVDSLPVRDGAGEVRLYRPQEWRSVDPSAWRLPAYLRGSVSAPQFAGGVGSRKLAISVNGIIVGTATTLPLDLAGLAAQGSEPVWEEFADASEHHFLVRLPPESLHPGHNEIGVYAIVSDDSGPNPELLRFELK